MPASGKFAVVTGGSAGIGAATVSRLSAEGYSVITGARRRERLEAVAGAAGATALELDVTDAASVERFAAAASDHAGGRLALLVNNAGGALGLDRIDTARDDDWEWMYRANVLGTLRVTRALLGALIASGDGHVVNIGSIAGFETYPGGAG